MKFNKKALVIAVAAVMAPGFAAAGEGTSVSGFADITYTASDDAGKSGSTNTEEKKFNANAEADFITSPADGVTVRVDLDLGLPALNSKNGGGATDSGDIEQAFFAWGAMEGVTVIGGVINDPIGYEAQDLPDMDFATHGAVYMALDSQTALPGDNIAGAAVAGAVGPVTLTGAVLNDIGETNKKNSLALVANYSPIEGLDLELGMVTQQDNMYTGTTAASTGSANALSVGNATNFNAVYTGVANLTLGVDYLTTAEVVDSAYDIWAGYDFGHGFGAKVRASSINYVKSDVANIVTNVGAAAANSALAAAGLAGADEDMTTIYLTYKAASNLTLGLEQYKHKVTGQSSVNRTMVKLVATY